MRRGDPASFDELLSRFEGPLYRYFLGSCGDPQMAGEATGDCFSELFRALPKMSAGADRLRPFVFGVARNVARRRRRNQRHDASPLADANQIVCAAAGPVQIIEAREELARLLGAIDSLDETTRDVLLLRFVEQLPLAEIEFSLHRLKDAQPWGVLQDGRIAITHPDGTSIEIFSVANGADERIASGGPYRVWVRWNKPSTTATEFRKSIADFRENLAADARNGNAERKARLEQLDKELARDPGPWIVGCSGGDLNPRDVVEDAR
ncbi:MAG: sigma-70 family RNA polymerase sigma factor [Planctomycetales bacterium]|nr:sigma-70 family RNA polymerase sigma factor [Planctomycetales bacterium]